MKNDCAVIILSAGESSRMGTHKALLKFDKNITFIEQITNVYTEFGCRKIVIVANPENYPLINSKNLKAEIIVNQDFKKGRFLSIQTGASLVNDYDYVFLHNIDNPFITTEILNKLYTEKQNNCYISPVYKTKGGHPILLHRSIIAQIQMKKTQIQNFKSFLQPFCRKNVLINDTKILININTIEQYNNFINKKNK